MGKKFKIKMLTRQLELERKNRKAEIREVRRDRALVCISLNAMRKERNKLLDDCKNLQADYEGIAYKYADMRTERNEVLKERDGLHGRQKLLKVERDQLITKVDIVRDERDERAANYKYAIDTLVNERDAARTERNELRDELRAERNGTNMGGRFLEMHENLHACVEEKDALRTERDNLKLNLSIYKQAYARQGELIKLGQIPCAD